MWKNYDNWLYSHMNFIVLLVSPVGLVFTFFLAGDRGLMLLRLECILYVAGLLLLACWFVPAAVVQMLRRKRYLKEHFKRKWLYIRCEVMSVYWIALVIVQPILSLWFYKAVFSRFLCWFTYFLVWIFRLYAFFCSCAGKEKYLSQEDAIRQYLHAGRSLDIIAVTLDGKTRIAGSEQEVKESGPFFLTDLKLKEKYRESIAVDCRLIQPGSQEELDEMLPRLYEESLGQLPDRLGMVFVAVRRVTPGMPSFLMPECLKGCQGVRYFEYDHDSIFKGEVFWRTFYKSGRERNGTYYFGHPYMLFELLPKDCREQFQNVFRNKRIYEFLHNAFVMDQPFQSVMALLDYGELILRCCAYFMFLRQAAPIHDYIERTPRCAYRYNRRLEDPAALTKADIQTLAEIISAGAASEEEIYPELRSKLFEVEGILKISIFQPLEQLLEIRFQEEQFDFIGLCSVIRYIRNRIKAHGSIQDKNIGCIWNFLAYSMLILSAYLRIWDFDVCQKNDGQWCGYPGAEVKADPFFHRKDDSFCVLHDMKVAKEKKVYEYINYFEGEMIVPVIR